MKNVTHLTIPNPIRPLIESGKLGWWFAPHGAHHEGDALQIITIAGDNVYPAIETVCSIHGDEDEFWLPNAEFIIPMLLFRRPGEVLDTYSLMGQTFKKGEYVYAGSIGGMPPEFNQMGCTIEHMNRIDLPLDVVYQALGYLDMTCLDFPTKIDLVQWGKNQIVF